MGKSPPPATTAAQGGGGRIQAVSAEEVEEDHGAVGGVVPGQAAVVHPLDERDGREGKVGDSAALEEGVEEAEDDGEHDGDDDA